MYSKPQFELYYPTEFAEEVMAVLSEPDQTRRRESKKRLLNEVRTWLDADEVRAKNALELSAAEIISDLRAIESLLMSRSN